MAAELPTTKIRQVCCGFSTGKANGGNNFGNNQYCQRGKDNQSQAVH